MAKLVVLLCFALLAMTLVMGCNPPGVPCTSDSDCCTPFICHPWARRCTGGPTGAAAIGLARSAQLFKQYSANNNE